MRQGHVAVAEHPAAPAAELVATLGARPAMAARDQRLHRDPIADVDAPAAGGAVADALDDAERLVARNQREAHRQDPGVLLGVAPADAAGLHAEQRALVVDVRHRQLAQLEATGARLHDRPAGAGRRHRPPP